MSRSLTRSPGRARRRTRSPGDAVSGWSTARPSPLQVELDSPPGHDKYSAYFYRPHFLTALFAAFAALTYVAFFTSGIDLAANVKRGLLGTGSMFLLYCSLPEPVPNGLFTRPHPLVWRVVTGAGILYLMLLTFILFQTVHDARLRGPEQYLITFVDPCWNGVSCSPVTVIGHGQGLTKPLSEREYAAHCEVWTGGEGCKLLADRGRGEVPCFAHLQDAVLDEYILAHFLGWIGKSLIFRHAGAAWINSIVFEFVEMSFEHWMPNFAECWWDHIILDVLVCNLLGIVVGHWLMHWLEVKKYRWMNVSQYNTPMGKMTRVLGQFSPESWDSFNWHALESPKRLFVVVLIFVCVLLVDFSSFALKYILWVPPRNPLNTYRLLLWCFLGMLSVREFYEYSTNPLVKRLGHHAWLGAMIMLTEALVWSKFAYEAGEFRAPMPRNIVLAWVVCGAAFLLWCHYHFRVVPARLRKAGKLA